MDAQESTESKDPVLFYAALLVGGLSLPPFPFPAAPLGLWGRREVRTRCGGDGGCTLETLKLDRGSKKVPRSRRIAANDTKPMLFCCVSKGSNKKVLEDPFPKQQNGGFVSGLLYTRNRDTPFQQSIS